MACQGVYSQVKGHHATRTIDQGTGHGQAQQQPLKKLSGPWPAPFHIQGPKSPPSIAIPDIMLLPLRGSEVPIVRPTTPSGRPSSQDF